MSVVATLSDVGHQGRSVTGTRPQIQEVSAVIYICSGLVYMHVGVYTCTYICMHIYVLCTYVCFIHRFIC